MEIVHIFTNSSGESEFKSITIQLKRDGVEQSITMPTPTAMIFNQTDSDHQYDWHNAPAKQLVVTLQGAIEVELRDGTKKIFESGSILLADDLNGTGHATRVISKEPWRCLYLPFSGNL